jgi:hypothetical protein
MSNAAKISVVAILAVAGVAAALVLGGRYHVSTLQRGGGYIMLTDRLLGTVYSCAFECRRVRYVSDTRDQPPASPKKTLDFGQNDPIVRKDPFADILESAPPPAPVRQR